MEPNVKRTFKNHSSIFFSFFYINRGVGSNSILEACSVTHLKLSIHSYLVNCILNLR